ncbi:hypothetical protein P5673_015508 [Acropora cervicornis]|uniref:Uncharacterized protein n=1 Tax=Acropora cervicornis TaxID=6130 RepID=A0AAD9QHT7_ACRCE|nr:hypothetical protein P5673_015508 [Acropora cervicornis]
MGKMIDTESWSPPRSHSETKWLLAVEIVSLAEWKSKQKCNEKTTKRTSGFNRIDSESFTEFVQ